jgi:glycosyltransferase involved in cell wall biosynthesis
MRILQINQCHYKRGGADIVYLNTIALLKSMGHEVACFSTQNERNEDSPFNNNFLPSINIRNQNFSRKITSILPYIYNKEAYKRLKRLIHDFKPEVAHVHLFYATLSVSVLDALKDCNIPVLLTVHDYRLLCPVSAFLDKNYNPCEKCATLCSIACITKRCSNGKLGQSTIVALESLYWKNFNSPFSKIDLFHFVSKFCRDKHLEYHPEIRDKNFVMYNFSGFQKSQLEISSAKYFLYYGRLSPEKGIITLINAWKTLPKNIQLKIVGGGILFNDIKDEIISNRLENIELLGYKSGIELESIIKNSSFVIVPSEWYENNPMTIIESYNLGIPVIGSNMGGIPEIIINDKTGFIFKSKDQVQLSEIIINANSMSKNEYQQFSENSYDFAKINFTPTKHYEKLIHTYEVLLIKSKSKHQSM